jgi:hypothetical protein
MLGASPPQSQDAYDDDKSGAWQALTASPRRTCGCVTSVLVSVISLGHAPVYAHCYGRRLTCAHIQVRAEGQ